jgi:hypothetical protein
MATEDDGDHTIVGTALSSSQLIRFQLQPVVDLPSDYCACIGEIASRWNWLEHQLGVLIREGFDLDKQEGRVLVTGMPLKAKTRILRVLALKWITDLTLRDDLRRFSADCEKQSDPRNEYVQGLWVRPAMDTAKLGLMVRKPGESSGNPEFKPVPIVEMRKIAADLKVLQERAQTLTIRMKGQV